MLVHTKPYGEIDVDGLHSKDLKSFSAKSVSTRALIVVAGVWFNILLAVFVFYFLLVFNGFTSYQSLIMDYDFPFGKQQNFVMISSVADDSPAEAKGINPQDIIVEGNKIEFRDSNEFINFIKENKGKEIELKTKNLLTKEVRDVTIIPRVDSPENQGALGVGLNDIAELSYPSASEKITSGFLHCFNVFHYSLVGFGHLIKVSFQEISPEPITSSVMGPIGILAATDLILKAGIFELINFLGLISVALAFFNILPIPALDGGKLLFLGIEAIRKKPISQKFEQNITTIFFILLMLLLVLITIKDFQRFF